MSETGVRGIDLFKIAGESISGWIPSWKTGDIRPTPNSLHHLLNALSEIPRSLAICILLFPLVSKSFTVCCLNSFV